jgi:hypothetical protein
MEVTLVVNLYAMANRHTRVAALGATALASAPSLLYLRDSIAQLIGHFHLEYATALFIVSLITEGSWWVVVWFPYVLPVEVTVQVLVAIFGIGYAVFW